MIVNLLSWFGAIGLMVAPFIIDTLAGKLLASASLLSLIPQTLQKRAYNLTLLNIVGIVGYFWSIS